MNFCFEKFVRKESFLLFLKQRLFLPCPKTIQLFYRAARIKCKKLEVSTMSRYWDFLLINLLACLLTESVFCDFLSNVATNLKSVFCKRCEIPGIKLFISDHFKLPCSISSQNSKNWFFNLNKTNKFTRENPKMFTVMKFPSTPQTKLKKSNLKELKHPSKNF